MSKSTLIDLLVGSRTERIPVLFESRSVLAMDKPAGWMLAPSDWRNTARNLQAAIEDSLMARDYWVRSRNLRFLRYIHRLDAETSGVLLFIKSPGAVAAYTQLFESRQMEKVYLAVVRGVPRKKEWTCTAMLGPASGGPPGLMRVDEKRGKEAVTDFQLVETREDSNASQVSLVRAMPRTGRTHQIRVHLAESGCPVLGDALYGGPAARIAGGTPDRFPMALRSIVLAYRDPFTKEQVRITAPDKLFLKTFGFGSEAKAKEQAGPETKGAS